MSEQNKDKLDRESWIEHSLDSGGKEPPELPADKSVEHWEEIALRGRRLLADESEAAALLSGIDAAIDHHYGKAGKKSGLSGRRNFLRRLSVAAATLLLALAGWWFWPRSVDTEQLYATYFTHPGNELSVTLMGASDPDALAQSLRPYNARRYAEAEQSIGQYLAGHPETHEIRLYYGVSLLETGKTAEAITQFQLLQKNLPNTNFAEVAEWYLALAYLRSGDTKQAGALLEKIMNSEHPQAEQAAKLLSAL